MNINWIYSTLIVLGLFSCSKEQATEENHEHSEPSNIATLSDEQIKTIGISMGTIELKPINSTIKANGYLKVPTTNKGRATSMFGGVVRTLNVQIGDYVKKGQVIALIENPVFLQAQEEYLSTNNKLNFAEIELKRLKELHEGGAGALKNIQSTESDLASMKTRIATLAKQIQLMGINPSTLTNANLKTQIAVTSPISGSISEVFAQIGSYIDASTPVAEIVDNDHLHLDLQLFEKDIHLVKLGQKIHFVLTNNPEKSYVAQVHTIGSTFENESKTVAMHATVLGKTTGMIDGMSVTGLLNIEGANTQAVPNDAIINAAGRYYIFVQKEHVHTESAHEHTNEFLKVEVVKGASDLGYTAITPLVNLEPDAKIVTKGAFFVNAKLEQAEGHDH